MLKKYMQYPFFSCWCDRFYAYSYFYSTLKERDSNQTDVFTLIGGFFHPTRVLSIYLMSSALEPVGFSSHLINGQCKKDKKKVRKKESYGCTGEWGKLQRTQVRITLVSVLLTFDSTVQVKTGYYIKTGINF